MSLNSALENKEHNPCGTIMSSAIVESNHGLKRENESGEEAKGTG